MAEGTKKLYRSNDNRWLAGVCGGVAEYFDVDPTLIRVLFILFSFVVGGGLIVYLILWLVIPLAPDVDAPQPVEGDIVKCCGSTLNQRRLPEPLK